MKECSNGSRKVMDRLHFLIKGARRIGKSTIAEEFARREYDSYINIDFSIADAAVKELFSHISDLDYFFCGFSHYSMFHCMNENRLSFR